MPDLVTIILLSVFIQSIANDIEVKCASKSVCNIHPEFQTLGSLRYEPYLLQTLVTLFIVMSGDFFKLYRNQDYLFHD